MGGTVRSRHLTAGFAAALALGLIAVLASVHDLGYFSSDAAQYLSTALNFVNGDGLSSDLVYYDEQYARAGLPAPQTVFPPGLPTLLALPLAAGVDPKWASFAVGAMALAATAIVMGVWLVRLELALPFVFLGIGSWLALALASVNVLLGLSEVVFTAASTAAVFLMLSRGRGLVHLLAGGALAAAAVSIRYQSVFFLVALALWGCIYALTRSGGRFWPAGRTLVAMLALPALAALALVGRNVLLLGAAGGGPIDTVRSGVGVIESLRHLYWALNDISGLAVSRHPSALIEEVLIVGGVLLLVLGVWMNRGALRSTPARGDEVRQERRTVLIFAVVYVGVTVGGLLYLGATRAGAYLQGRYLVSVVPFALVAWSVLADRTYFALPERRRAVFIAGLALLYVGFLAGQADTARRWMAQMQSDHRIEVMRRALATQVDGSTLQAYLQERVSRRSPVIAEPGQHLWLLLQRPILAPAGAGFSQTLWTAQEVRRLQNCYGAEYVLFFPTLFNPTLPHNATRLLFAQLKQEQVPAFMLPVVHSADVALYRLAPDPSGHCSALGGKR